MAQTTLSQLITEVRRRANLEQSSLITDSEQFITDDEITHYINEGASELHEDLVLTHEHYSMSVASATIASGNTFSLPSDFFKLRLIERYTSDSPDGYMTLAEIDLHERNSFSAYPDVLLTGIQLPRYMLIENEIHIEPAYAAPGNYRIWYAPTFANLTNDNDAVDLPDNWHAFIVVYAALQCRIKENISGTNELQGQLARLKTRILSAAARRGQPKQIKNLRYQPHPRWRFMR